MSDSNEEEFEEEIYDVHQIQFDSPPPAIEHWCDYNNNYDEHQNRMQDRNHINKINEYQIKTMQSVTSLPLLQRQLETKLSKYYASIEQQHKYLLNESQQLHYQYTKLLNKLDQFQNNHEPNHHNQRSKNQFNNYDHRNENESFLHPTIPPLEIQNISNKQYMPCCDGKLSQCDFFNELQQQMTMHDGDEEKSLPNSNELTSILNNFLHLIEKHNDTDSEFDCEFEHIFKALGGYCDIKKCEIFTRNNRDRKEMKDKSILFKLYNSKNNKEMVNRQIIDKIHCYYRHCYDIGNELSSKQKDELLLAQNDNIDNAEENWLGVTINMMLNGYSNKEWISFSKSVKSVDELIENSLSTAVTL